MNEVEKLRKQVEVLREGIREAMGRHFESDGVQADRAWDDLDDALAAADRIAELDSMLDRSCSAYQDDIEKLNARIAELEDWQRRAVGTGLLDEHNGCQCRTCRDVAQLLSEVKP